MAVDVETEIEIARSRADVAAYAQDPVNAPEWYVNIEAVEPRANRKDLERLKQILESRSG